MNRSNLIKPSTPVRLEVHFGVVDPPFSEISFAAIETVSSGVGGTSSFKTFSVFVPLTAPDAVALIVTNWVPSTRLSLTASMTKLADAWPAGITTLPGTIEVVLPSRAARQTGA